MPKTSRVKWETLDSSRVRNTYGTQKFTNILFFFDIKNYIHYSIEL